MGIEIRYAQWPQSPLFTLNSGLWKNKAKKLDDIPWQKLYSDNFSKQIVVTLSQQLSWSHFIALLPLESAETFMFYGQDTVARRSWRRSVGFEGDRKRAYNRPSKGTIIGSYAGYFLISSKEMLVACALRGISEAIWWLGSPNLGLKYTWFRRRHDEVFRQN